MIVKMKAKDIKPGSIIQNISKQLGRPVGLKENVWQVEKELYKKGKSYKKK
jgi:hypothetical protein|tara:strand:- start:757 stop:909 length:153 start_codon:yes stop_codon:yes gene_type:complete